jgi:tetratricopeptide (TPR) repeat protein
VGDISRKKVKQPSPATKKKDIKIEKEKRKEREIETYLDLGKKTLSEKDYDKALDLAKKIQRLDPKNKSALQLKNEAYYMSGKTLFMENKYLESLNMFEHIQQDYKDVNEITAAIKIKINAQAEHHYKQGVKYFINEELKKAIEEWEKTLVFNPNHPKALKDIENAKHILEELDKLN